MTASRLTGRVAVDGGVVVALLAVAGGVVGGGRGAASVVVGGAVALLNFRWLTADVLAACAAVDGRRRPGAWLPWAALRFAALVVACGVLLGGGFVHPLGLVAGLTAVPCALVTAALRDAREEAQG